MNMAVLRTIRIARNHHDKAHLDRIVLVVGYFRPKVIVLDLDFIGGTLVCVQEVWMLGVWTTSGMFNSLYS